jgi:hypothetical protein
MASGSTILAIFAWLFKVMLLLVGVVMLVSPGYALYLRAIGLFLLAVAILTFRTVQASLLAERGIRIPNIVVAILLIGSLMVWAVVIPGAGDLEPSNESLETTDGALVFSADVTNTADGPTLGEDFVIAVNASDETIAETRLEDEEFGRDETRTLTAELVSVAALSESERTRIENDEFEIVVTIDPDSTEITWRYSASELR